MSTDKTASKPTRSVSFGTIPENPSAPTHRQKKKGEPAMAPLSASGQRSNGRRLLRHHPNLVVQHLHESAADPEAPTRTAEAKLALSEQGHQRRVAAQNSHFTVVGGRDHCFRFAFEQHGFRRNDRYVKHRLLGRELLGALDHAVDPALHEERLLRVLIELAGHQALERRDRLLEVHVLALDAGKLLGNREWLGHEALDSPRAPDHELVLLRQLIHAEDRDDVLKLLIALQNALDIGRYLIVALADELRIE